MKEKNVEDRYSEIIGSNIKSYLKTDTDLNSVDLGRMVTKITRFCLPENLLNVAGIDINEKSIVKLICWYLSPEIDEKTACLRQNLFISSLVGKDFSIENPVSPQSEYAIESGRIDIVLDYIEFTVAIEVKLESNEHLSGMTDVPQTTAYEKHFVYKNEKPVYMIFLTKDREKAHNEVAINRSYLELIICLTSALERARFSSEVAFMIRMTITHIFQFAVPDKLRAISEIDYKINSEQNDLPQLLKILRKSVKMTQKEFAMYVGISPRILAEFETGKGNPTYSTLCRFFRPFNLELSLKPIDLAGDIP